MHNAAGFDNFILLEHFSNVGIITKITMTGCRLIYMYDECFKRRYIDSYSFTPMHLANMSAALNLSTVEKGHFPHAFNKQENNSYRGPYPEKHYYGYDNMSNTSLSLSDMSYNEVAEGVFDFQKEFYKYGRNYVVLLREACLKYRAESIECTGLDPFSYTTLAFYCMAVYKTCFLPKDTLALTHNKAYVNQHKAYKNISIEWLEFDKETRNVDIHHALTQGEMMVGKYHLDGYYEKDGERIALKFNGCMRTMVTRVVMTLTTHTRCQRYH